MPLVAIQNGYYRFSAIFAWDHTEDARVVQRLSSLHENLEKFGIRNSEGMYLIGKRTFILIGQTKSATDLQRLCSTVTFGNTISANISHVVDAHELAGIMPSMAPRAQKMK